MTLDISFSLLDGWKCLHFGCLSRFLKSRGPSVATLPKGVPESATSVALRHEKGPHEAGGNIVRAATPAAGWKLAAEGDVHVAAHVTRVQGQTYNAAVESALDRLFAGFPPKGATAR